MLAQKANRARATASALTVAMAGGERLGDRTDGVRLLADKKNAAHALLLRAIHDNSVERLQRLRRVAGKRQFGDPLLSLVVAWDKKLMPGQPSSRLGWIVIAITTMAMFAARVWLCLLYSPA
jgi:hypothetical protein